MTIETELLANTRSYAEAILTERLSSTFLFHNADHTRDVVKAAAEIGAHSGFSEKELETVLIAAWLHDVGYRDGKMDHERTSMHIARTFLEGQNVSEKRIEKVLQCIAATKMPQNPENMMAQVLCDADLYHLAADNFADKAELLRQEISIITGEKIGKKKWLRVNQEFYNRHSYFTEYGRNVLEPRKRANLQKIADTLAEKEAQKQQEKSDKELMKAPKEDKPKEDKKADKPSRGIETMFRVTSQNHFELSAMADNKANIMISINSIIVSLLVSILIRKFEEYPNLIVPTLILTIVCLLTIIFAVLATRPNVTQGTFTKEDIANKQANLLFFGNFYNMSLEDYELGVQEMMKDAEFLYGSMTRDIYFLGKVLGRKYKLLRISYTIFMFGFVIAIVSFGIAVFFFPVEG